MFKCDFDSSSISTLANTGWGSISYKIEGFWSSDPLKIYITRESGIQGAPNWKFNISWSSGGRDTKEVEDDAVAALNFAKAVENAAQLVQQIRETMLDQFEAAYQAQLRQYALEAKEAREKLERAREADAPMTAQTVENLLRRVIDSGERVRLYERGDEFDRFLLENTGISRVNLTLNGNTFSRKALMRKLLSGEFSNRYKFA